MVTSCNDGHSLLVEEGVTSGKYNSGFNTRKNMKINKIKQNHVQVNQ